MEVSSSSSNCEILSSSSTQSSFSSSSSGDSSPYEANNWPGTSWDEWGYFPEASRAYQHPAEGSGNYWLPPLPTVHPAAHHQQQYFGTEHETTTTFAGYQQYTVDYATPWFFTQGNYYDSRVAYEYCQTTTTYYTAPSMHAAEGYQEAATASSTSTTPGEGFTYRSPFVAEEDHHADSDTWVQDLVEVDVKPFPVPLPVPVVDPHPVPDSVYASVPVENEHSLNGQSDVETPEEQPISSQASDYSTDPGNLEDIIHQCDHCSRFCVSAGGLKRHVRFCSSLRLVSLVAKPDSQNGAAGQPSDTLEQQQQQQQQQEIQQSQQPNLQQQQQQPAFVKALRRSALRVRGEKRAARGKSGTKQHACSVCGVRFGSERALLEHLAAHGIRKAYSCIHCKSQFSRKFHLTRHIKQRGCDGGPRVSFPCELCHKTFSRKDNLREHIKSHTGQTRQRPRIPCPVHGCSKSFQGKTQLQSHLNAHAGVRPYVCTACDKSFRSNAALRKHARLHNIPRPFICSICQACFASKDTLLLHTQTHRDDVCFRCSQCSSAFSDVTKLRLHVQQQHREPQQLAASSASTSSHSFCCNDCSRRFPTQQLLLVHGVSHATRGSRLACHECRRSFVHPSGLLRHLRIRHRYSDSDAEQRLLRHGASVKQLEKNIIDLLNLLVEPQVLVDLGYPQTRPGLLLDSVLRRCGQHPATNDDYVQQLRANTKMLFQCIVEDQNSVENLLQSCEVNDVLQQVISLARANQNPQ